MSEVGYLSGELAGACQCVLYIVPNCAQSVVRMSHHENDSGLFSSYINYPDTDGTIILFLTPWYFSAKYQGIKEQYYRPVVCSA